MLVTGVLPIVVVTECVCSEMTLLDGHHHHDGDSVTQQQQQQQPAVKLMPRCNTAITAQREKPAGHNDRITTVDAQDDAAMDTGETYAHARPITASINTF